MVAVPICLHHLHPKTVVEHNIQYGGMVSQFKRYKNMVIDFNSQAKSTSGYAIIYL